MLTKNCVFLGITIWSCFVSNINAQTTTANNPTTGLTKFTGPSGELRNWSLKYQNYTNGQTFQDPSGSSINHYFDLSRKVNKWTVGGVARQDSEWVSGEGQKNIIGDHYVKIVTPKLDPMRETTINGNVRYYFPTSDESKIKDQDFAVEPRVYVISKVNDKTELSSILIPKVYGYKNSEAGQVMAKIGNYFQATYAIDPSITLDFGVYPNWTFVRESSVADFNDLPMYPGATVNFTDNFSVSPYVEVFASRVKYKTSSLGAFVSYAAF